MKLPIIIVLVALSVLPASADLIRRSKGNFKLEATINGKKIEQKVYYCGPRQTKSDTRVVIVMHGNQRNADDYRDAWKRHSEEENLLVLVPEFSEKIFPGSNAYNLGGMVIAPGRFSPRENWAFSLIDILFSAVKEDQELDVKRFYLYGHSAGAQFVHRYVMFHDSPQLGLAISANAGWYTFPSTQEGFPYGLGQLPFPFDAKRVFATKLKILLGSSDNDPNHKYLRKTEEALRQGVNRLERGKNFYETAKRVATKQGVGLSWSMSVVPNVGHSNSGMSKAALKVITSTDI